MSFYPSVRPAVVCGRNRGSQSLTVRPTKSDDIGKVSVVASDDSFGPGKYPCFISLCEILPAQEEGEAGMAEKKKKMQPVPVLMHANGWALR